MNQPNPFEQLESRTMMSITHMPIYHPTLPVAPIVVPLVPAVSPTGSVTAPTALTAKRLADNDIYLTWKGDGTAIRGYTIERSLNGTTGWDNIGTTGSMGRSFTVQNVTEFSRYFYRVVSAGTGNAVAFSNVVGTPPKRL